MSMTMKIAIIHGQSHKGSTYHIAHTLTDQIRQKQQCEVTEFFLPRDFGDFCVGCGRCFSESEEQCPHYERLAPITAAMDAADVIILASPVYVYHATGAMKSFLDHYGYQWMVHRPKEAMFRKQGVCISTAAGAGMKSTNKDMADSLFFWGTGKIYKYGNAVHALNWDGISEKNRKSIDREMAQLAGKIVRRYEQTAGAGERRKGGGSSAPKPGLKTRGWFTLMHFMQRRGFNARDAEYWKEKGWTGKKRPWK